jgi:hypothetical protein
MVFCFGPMVTKSIPHVVVFFGDQMIPQCWIGEIVTNVSGKRIDHRPKLGVNFYLFAPRGAAN